MTPSCSLQPLRSTAHQFGTRSRNRLRSTKTGFRPHGRHTGNRKKPFSTLPSASFVLSTNPLASIALPVTGINPLSHEGRAQHQRVGDYEHPISQQPAVDDKSDRGRYLPDKEPL